MNVMIFDIETVPDVEGGRRVYDLGDLSDKDAGKAMQQMRVQKTGRDFMAHHFQKIVAISIVFRHSDQIKVWSLGEADAPEEEIIRRFFDGLDRYSPTLVSWNGSGFDLPVIHYRALLQAVAAPRYWDVGEDDSSFKFNNYLNRFQWRHTDLMDVLAGYQMRSAAPLDEIATLLGFPGKMGMSGAKVWDTWLDGRIEDIRNYCETDVLNTYLVYLRFQHMRGKLTDDGLFQEYELLRNLLETSDKKHFTEFSNAWVDS